MNPFARLASSLANAVLDLGLPTIRGWLRERLGDGADVANVTTDGSVVSLEGVHIPLGPRGVVILDRAAATITSLGDAGPAIRLHSFTGVLVFGPLDAPSFRADIAFAAGDDPDPAAWIWGDVTIANALWASSSSELAGALNGGARLFVSSRAWSLTGGRLDGGPSSGADAKPPVSARFAASGELEPQNADVKAKAVASAALTLEHARVGPFIDAATALAGGSVKIPRFVPRDAQLDGEMAWSEAAGGRAELRLRAGTIGVEADVRATCAADGSALDAKVAGRVILVPFLRRIGAPAFALPREDDAVGVRAEVRGAVRAPVAAITLDAPELGFRFGRPRFVPPVLLRDLAGTIAVEGGKATGSAKIRAGKSEILATLEGTRVEVAGDAIDAAFLRDVVCALGVKLTVPDDFTAALALTYRRAREARDVGAAGFGAEPHVESVLGGTVTLASVRSRVVASLGAPIRIAGGLTAADVVATGAFAGASVYPSHGDVVVALDVADGRARGSLAAAGKLDLTIAHRPDMAPYVVEGAHVAVAIDASGVAYEDLRFTGYGGEFTGRGRIAFGGAQTEPYLVLQLARGGMALADALYVLAPRPALHFPAELAWTGTLTLGAALAIDANLATPSGTNLNAAVRLRKGDLTGSVAKGALAIADALGLVDTKLPIAAEGLVILDADVARGLVFRIAASSAQMLVPPITLNNVAASIVIANGDVFWNRADALLADGRVSSFGVVRKDNGEWLARVSAAAISVDALPEIGGKLPRSYVRGRASGSVVVHRAESFAARGDVVLDEAAFPVIERARPALERYGLRPPSEDATSPAVATIAVSGTDVHVSDIAVGLHGASVRGAFDVRSWRTIDGRVEIVLAEEYLRTSKVLTLPRVLSDQLVIPVRIGGTLSKAEVHGELGPTLGRFLRESKMGELVASAVEEAQLFFRHSKPPPAPAPPPSSKLPDWETPLRSALDAHAEAWEALAQRR